MKDTKFFQPYTEKKCTLKKTGAGTYIIKKEDKIFYVGHSQSDVKKTMYRHFQEWNDKTQYRVTYKNLKGITCRVIFTTPSKAQKLEEALILRYKPRDNQLKLELYSPKEIKQIEEEFFSANTETPF